MKIAILGKGGSGKSSITWLIANYISQELQFQTLAIDGDHNMDLTSNLNVDESKIKFFKDFNQELRKLSNMPEKGMWKEYFNGNKIEFQYPNDSKISQYIHKVNTNLDLIVVGLGDQDLMNYNVCSHGVSATIKYMLPTLTMADSSYLVYDSVAGVDMLNYGLYYGFDSLLVVVEGNKNSIKVAKQIQSFAATQSKDVKFILNKFSPNNLLLEEFKKNNSDNIIGIIGYDEGIENYNFNQVSQDSKLTLNKIITSIKSNKALDAYNKLKKFELNKK